MMGHMGMDKRLSSIHNLYMAMARGEATGFTVPAFNLRGMTEELAQGIFEAAKETKTSSLVLEIARSEMKYTAQPPLEFVRRVLVGANAASWTGPIFIQGDHSQAKAQTPGEMAPGEIERIKKLIDAEIEAGFYNIDIDASTLVDNSLPSVDEQQGENARVTAVLVKYIRERQPRGVEISIGGEIGHIGDRNSDEDDLRSFDKLFRKEYGSELVGLSKVSVQTGTAHGGHMKSDGTMEEMKIDFDVIERLSKVAKKMGMAGVVQHGASTLPEDMFDKFPVAGAIEIHLSTGWQNMILDHPDFPPDLLQEIYAWVDQSKGSERKNGESDKQFYYRMRKFAWGEFKTKIDKLDTKFKMTIKDEMKNRCMQLFKELKVENTDQVVEKYVNTHEGSELRSVEQADVRGKRIIVRVDWNVTLGKALQIVDDTRIVRTLPTIKWLMAHGALQIVLMSHLGKPSFAPVELRSGEGRGKFSLKPIVEYAEKLIGEKIVLCDTATQCQSDTSKLIMLENLRLWEGEDKNDPEFAKRLASLGEIYVNEAFGECHRSSASIVGIPKYLPSYGGFWLRDEVETILRVRDNPEHPYVVVMGGAKVDDKIKLIEVLSKRADTILLGGKLANEYVQRGIKVGGQAKIMVPLEGSNLLDIGAHTQALYVREIAKAKTIVWNGPMGKVEEVQYRAGTEAIYIAINANEVAYTLVGGGDTLAAITQEQHLTRIDHVSTGGGAMLKLLESGSLVGIEKLMNC